jgi:L-alanine-DL-glutamate epimerase-like enolase superfamily enzyme
MRIKSADVIPLKIPFDDGGSGQGLMPSTWNALDFALLRLETEDGLVGWGEGFSYYCRTAVVAAMRDMVAPLVVGQEAGDIPAFNRALQQRLHLHGRYGITTFAISAFDTALWDLAAKREGVSLATLLGGRKREVLPAYASLVRYGDPALVERQVAAALEEGYGTIKLHEIALDAIEAGRRAAGPDTPIVTDVNCNWSAAQAQALMPEMRRLGLYWVEEPLFPPDDGAALGALEREFGVAIASGENACTSVEFARTAPHIRFLQPSVSKVGGVSEFLAVCSLAEEHGKVVMPHSPYFGPGYCATAQLMSALPVCELFEFLYIRPEAWLDRGIPSANGQVTVPDRPGIGFEPDPAVLERYAA